MAKSIRWSPEAVADRVQILNYWNIKTGNKRYSIYLDNTFKEIVSSIKKFSKIGRVYHDLPDKNIRYLIKDYYQFFYRETLDSIDILHVWDTRRDPESLSF